MNSKRILKVLFLGLSIFDLILGISLIFFGKYLFSAIGLPDYGTPRFFMICVGLFLLLYTYIQFMVYKDPVKYSFNINMTFFIRLSFPFIYTSAIFLWGHPHTIVHTLVGISAAGDLLACAAMLILIKKLKIPFFKGNVVLAGIGKGEPWLRIILLVLAIAEFVISWNWILIPQFWLKFFDVSFSVDPFWTRATGIFLLNIAYIQFMGCLHTVKYRDSVVASALFRALWPILYVYWTAFGEGNVLFKVFIMFFAFFDTVMCIVIFKLLHKSMNPYKKSKYGKESSIVACAKDEDKFKALDKAIQDSGFVEDLEKMFSNSQKEKSQFLVAVKPNIAIFVSRDNYVMITDPQLVEHLIDRIVEQGFTNVKVVEARMALGEFLENRDVKTIAHYAGYTEKNYKLIDLTDDKIPYKFSGALGDHFVGKTWHDADYRISFAKNKTHPWCYYTLSLKNIFGCCPIENKIKEYHKEREWETAAFDMLKTFPVNFGFIDAFVSADGPFGLSGDRTPEKTKSIICGRDLIAVDWFGATKMDLDPMVHSLMQLAVKEWGKPVFEVIGDATPYKDWENVSDVHVESLDIIEESESAMRFIMHMLGPKCDPLFKDKNPLAEKIRKKFELYMPSLE
jgi:uncharacterized protein (DUF362 family)